MPILLPERVLPIRGFNVPSALPTHLSPLIVWPALALGLAALYVGVRSARTEPSS